MRKIVLFSIVILVVVVGNVLAEEYLGNLSVNPYAPNAIRNPCGCQLNQNSNLTLSDKYCSPVSPNSICNPYAVDTPKLYDSKGNYRGKLSSNPYDPDSVSNPYGQYGSPYSPDSINNPYGAGSPYDPDSPTNPYGSGLIIIGDD